MRSIRNAPQHLRIALVGAPNVGKSALFNRLTSRYVTVSNYPGTSVEVTRGSADFAGVSGDVFDTPGLYSLLPMSEDERAARSLLLEGSVDVVVHVLDAKNLPRMLSLTLQLLELGRPVVVAMNMMDEAERLGVTLSPAALERRLGTPVVPVIAVTGRGVEELRAAIVRASTTPVPRPPGYGNGVGTALRTLRDTLRGVYRVDPAAYAALLLQGDAEAQQMVRAAEGERGEEVIATARALAGHFDAPAPYRIAVERQRAVEVLLEHVMTPPVASRNTRAWRDRLGRALTRPATGVPALLVALYIGLYLFVGRLGGGTIVDWLDGTLFGRWINPSVERLFAGAPPSLASLFVGDYGLVTLGLRYAVALILPVVGAFFLFFSLLEDSGYLPRLALLVDRIFKRLGLSGRAVIPLVLGFACDTMATMVTRTLESRRERVLTTLLLALAIPCSAQLGVILALMAGQPFVFAVWTAAVVATFLLVGAIGARVLPGSTPLFHMELPPLRLPRAGNVLVKTYTRMQWYFLEVLPLFLIASVLLWVGERTGVLAALVALLKPVVAALGLPADTARIFLFGFFRRDYGAAGLYDLSAQGSLDPVQLAVAGVTLTLFVPCIAQFLMMAKERGIKTALGMLGFITPFAFAVGFFLNFVLRWLR